MYWLEFTFSAILIIVAGVRLTKYADILSEKSKIAKAWIGIILLGLVTSLPEAVTSVISIKSLAEYDLALGNILGSNCFNPVLVVAMDFVYRKGSITNDIKPNKTIQYSCLLAIVLNLLVITEIILSHFSASFSFGSLSVGSILIFLVYIFGVRFLSSLDDGAPGLRKTAGIFDNVSSAKVWVNIVMSSLVIIVAAVWLTRSCDTIAEVTGLGHTFVGSLMLALVTSLPEMVVVISSLKLGSVDLAMGNIFGSNMINIFILAVAGLTSGSGPLLASVSLVHILTACVGIILTYLAWVGILFENKKTFLGLGLDSIIMIVIFLTGMGALFAVR